MPFVGTVLLLAALVSAILIPIFVGHGLATGSTGAILLGLGSGVVSAILVFLFSRVVGRDAAH